MDYSSRRARGGDSHQRESTLAGKIHMGGGRLRSPAPRNDSWSRHDRDDRVWGLPWRHTKLKQGESTSGKVEPLMITAYDINYHSERCSEYQHADRSRHRNESGYTFKLQEGSQKECVCCLVRLQAIRAIEQDISEHEEESYGIHAILCYADGQFVSYQGRHDADGVKHFPRIYFDVSTIPGSPQLDGACIRNNPSGDTGSSDALNFAQRMISLCAQSHKACGDGGERLLPTRVLEISGLEVRLVEKGNELARYAALSHCWGGKIDVRTTSGTYTAFKERIPWDALPKTFQDAIVFSRKLGLQYIWIDSLCIIQDSRPDWHRESAKMKQVYEGATVTLAATASKDGTNGCFMEPKFRSWHIAKVQCGAGEVDLYARRRWHHIWKEREYWSKPLSAPYYPLLSRAWVFQERLLSARIIHFTTNELMWECREQNACECMGVDQEAADWGEDKEKQNIKKMFTPITKITEIPLADPAGSEPKHVDPKRVQSIGPFPTESNTTRSSSPLKWSQLINDYSELSLTCYLDRLPALSGIVKSFTAITGSDRGKYFAGLWENDLPQSLCWFARQPSRWRPQSSYPSWSWASVAGSISAADEGFGPFRRRHSGATIHKIQCSLGSDDVHGEVLAGALELSGELFVAYCVSVRSMGGAEYEEVTWLKFHDVAINFGGLSSCCLWDGSPPQVDSLVFCLKMIDGYESIYLVLEPLDWSSQIYRRIGLINESSFDRKKRTQHGIARVDDNSGPAGNSRLMDYDFSFTRRTRARRLSWGFGWDSISVPSKFPDGSDLPNDGKGLLRRITIE